MRYLKSFSLSQSVSSLKLECLLNQSQIKLTAFVPHTSVFLCLYLTGHIFSSSHPLTQSDARITHFFWQLDIFRHFSSDRIDVYNVLCKAKNFHSFRIDHWSLSSVYLVRTLKILVSSSQYNFSFSCSVGFFCTIICLPLTSLKWYSETGYNNLSNGLETQQFQTCGSHC